MTLVRLSRRTTTGLAVVLVAAATSVVLAIARPTVGMGATASPICTSANLRLDKIGESDFTSHRGWIFAIRNIGQRSCRLTGYPNIRLYNAHARPMPTKIEHFGGPARSVRLNSFQRAYFATTYAVSGPCQSAVFADGMGFTKPQTGSQLVYYAGRFDLCGPAPADVSVSPVSARRKF
jgi:Protein of unknown function (DUF4232)